MTLRDRNLVRCLLLCATFITANLASAQGLFGPIQAGDTSAFHVALQAGADINAADDYGQTPLMYAVTFNQLDMVEALIAAGANVNANTLAGWTALHYAARDATDNRTIEALLAAGADPAARNHDGQTPHGIASDHGNQATANALVSAPHTQSLPAQPAPPAKAFAQAIAPGTHHSIALLDDGTAIGFGGNYFGQLGDGTTTTRYAPVQIPGLTNVQAIAAGGAYSLALLQDGTVRAWGGNGNGELGDGSTINRHIPTTIPGLNNVQAIAAGSLHALALLTNGTVMAWGANYAGQVGDGTTTDRPTPVPIPGLTNVQAIAAGGAFSLALLQDGTVKAWGNNGWGELANEMATGSLPVPATIPGLTNVQAIAAGSTYALALLNDAAVVAWGSNSSGQLGDGTTTSRYTPTRIPGLTNVQAVAANGLHSLALLDNGTVKAWGYNHKGQLGDGTAAERHNPGPVQGLTAVQAIAAGGSTSFALLKDGTVLAWGNNDHGQLGLGFHSSAEQPNPAQVQDTEALAAPTWPHLLGTLWGGPAVILDHPLCAQAGCRYLRAEPFEVQGTLYFTTHIFSTQQPQGVTLKLVVHGPASKTANRIGTIEVRIADANRYPVRAASALIEAIVASESGQAVVIDAVKLCVDQPDIRDAAGTTTMQSIAGFGVNCALITMDLVTGRRLSNPRFMFGFTRED